MKLTKLKIQMKNNTTKLKNQEKHSMVMMLSITITMILNRLKSILMMSKILTKLNILLKLMIQLKNNKTKMKNQAYPSKLYTYYQP
jgi:hypothetical protein